MQMKFSGKEDYGLKLREPCSYLTPVVSFLELAMTRKLGTEFLIKISLRFDLYLNNLLIICKDIYICDKQWRRNKGYFFRK